MKRFALVAAILFCTESYAVVCKCNCDPADPTLCAPYYDLDNPCPISCNSPVPNAAPPIGKAACVTIKVYNRDKGIMEWRSFCPD